MRRADDDDAGLLLAAAGGDDRAFAEFYRRCRSAPATPGPNLHALAAAVNAGPLNGIPATVTVDLPGV